MGVKERLRGAWESLRVDARDGGARKTEMLPGLLTAFRPAGVANGMPKPTAANLRRFAETPLARRAINVVKDRIACMDWQVRWKRDAEISESASQQVSESAVAGSNILRTLRRCLEAPNPGDSFRTLMEQVIEDVLVGGFGAIEMEVTGDEGAPFRLWPVDGATIQVDGKWTGEASEPRYAQANGLHRTPLLDAELMYVRLNARTHTPFGLGRLEVAFEAISQFLQANRYAHRLASNSSSQFALWLQDATPEQHGRMVQWWRDCVEGSGEVPILSTETKPEVLRFSGGTDADLRLEWQEFLMRMIANAFDLPPMMLGVQHDVNRSTANEMAEEAFESAVKPVAKLVAEHITRDLFAKRLGLTEVEFVFNELMTEDDAKDVAVQVELLKAGVLTVDEVRRTLGCSAHGE